MIIAIICINSIIIVVISSSLLRTCANHVDARACKLRLQNGPLEVEIVMLSHGKLASSRADALTKFWEGLRCAASSSIPEWTLMKDLNVTISESAVSTGNEFLEHTITQDMIREAGFVEGVLVRKTTDKNMKSFNVWRISQVSDVSVTMLGEFDNTEKSLSLELAKFEASFILTPELDNEVLIMMIDDDIDDDNDEYDMMMTMTMMTLKMHGDDDD